MKELKIVSGGSMRLYYENKIAINIAHNLIQHDRKNTLRYINISSSKNQIMASIVYHLSQ